MHNDKAAIVKIPPKELAQWYKPENKRHVWLHNMFKLRREMQAVQFYAESKQDDNLDKWSSDLEKHYKKIAEMVPTWSKKLDLSTISRMQANVASKDYQGVLTDLDSLQDNCDACHIDYQAITALTYRAPDFSNIEMEASVSFNDHMQSLIKQVNQIKIASDDGMTKLALSSLADLKLGMKSLGQVCNDCHKMEKKPYPNKAMQQTLVSLEHNLVNGSRKDQGMDLGTLAVQACANCHGTHRLAFGIKSLLHKEQTFAELVKH